MHATCSRPSHNALHSHSYDHKVPTEVQMPAQARSGSHTLTQWGKNKFWSLVQVQNNSSTKNNPAKKCLECWNATVSVEKGKEMYEVWIYCYNQLIIPDSDYTGFKGEGERFHRPHYESYKFQRGNSEQLKKSSLRFKNSYCYAQILPLSFNFLCKNEQPPRLPSVCYLSQHWWWSNR